MKNNVHVVFITDEIYFEPMLVTIASMLEHSKRIIDISIFLTFTPLEYQSNILNGIKSGENVNVLYVRKIINSELEVLRAKNHVSSAAFIKTILTSLLPEVDKVIYLDSDLLVLEDIGMLWDLVDSKVELAAVRSASYFIDNEHLGLKKDDETFNSGLMVMNLDLMRQNQRETQLLTFLKLKNEVTSLNDQAAFNSVFKYNWLKLDLRWNVYVQNFIFGNQKLRYKNKDIKKSRMNPYIVHFNGSVKPWDTDCGHPYVKKYREYARRAGVFNDVGFSFKKFCSRKYIIDRLVYLKGKLILLYPF